MSGRPAETWRKFTFRTPPTWTYALLVLWCLGLLGIIVSLIIIGAVSVSASGHLPLTRSSRRIATLATWIPAGLILGSIAVMSGVVAAAVGNVDGGDPNAGSVAGVIFLASIFALVIGLIARLFVAPFLLPRAKVEAMPGSLDRIVELRNVSPAFTAATNQMYAERSAHLSAPQ